MADLNVSKLHGELVDAGLLIHGVDSNGIIHWVKPPTTEQLLTAGQVIANHDPTPVPVVSKVDKLADLLIAKEVITQEDYDNTKEMKP